MKKTAIKFNEAITVYRKRMHLSQRQLAEMLGVSQGFIFRCEKGTSEPSRTCFLSMVRILKIPLDIATGLKGSKVIYMYDLTDKQAEAVLRMVEGFRNNRCRLTEDDRKTI